MPLWAYTFLPRPLHISGDLGAPTWATWQGLLSLSSYPRPGGSDVGDSADLRPPLALSLGDLGAPTLATGGAQKGRPTRGSQVGYAVSRCFSPGAKIRHRCRSGVHRGMACTGQPFAADRERKCNQQPRRKRSSPDTRGTGPTALASVSASNRAVDAEAAPTTPAPTPPCARRLSGRGETEAKWLLQRPGGGDVHMGRHGCGDRGGGGDGGQERHGFDCPLLRALVWESM